MEILSQEEHVSPVDKCDNCNTSLNPENTVVSRGLTKSITEYRIKILKFCGIICKQEFKDKEV